jgi:Tol biopolymer transport system component/C-terminal processing protease CtpA/Prc
MRGWSFALVVSATVLSATPTLGADDANHPLWLRYPAVSPDGSNIAFAYGGSLYVVPADGGMARPLVTSDVYATRPVWSPDGQSIAFAADRFGNLDIFIMPAEGGAATRLTAQSSDDLPSGFTADGGEILFYSERLGDAQATYTEPSLSQHAQLYAVPAAGGRERMVLPIAAHEAEEAPGGGRLLYEDQPGIEQEWRKHDHSAQARDIWLYSEADGAFTRMSSFEGEDRNPVWSPDEKAIYWLSERSGSFNVWRRELATGAPEEQVTSHDTHPVRFLSISKGGDLVYAWDGEIWRLPAGAASPAKVDITLPHDTLDAGPHFVTFDYGASEFDISPFGSEIAFVVRGEVFVMSIDGEVTRRITDTVEQERNVSFSPDGRHLLYASERNGSWGLYESSIVLDDEPDFFDATLIEEATLLDTPADEFQPLYDPTGERVAFLKDREVLSVLDLYTGSVKTVLGEQYNYSYADGDIGYDWSPDGRWLCTSYAPNPNHPDVAVVDTRGNQPPKMLVPNGFWDMDCKWSADGRYVIWLSDILGLRRGDTNPEQMDVLLAAMTREAADRIDLGPRDFTRLQDKEWAEADAAAAEAEAEQGIDMLDLELDGVERRIFRITPFSTSIGFFQLIEGGEALVLITYEPAVENSYTASGYIYRHRSRSLQQLFTDLPVDWIDAEVSPDEYTLYMPSPWGFYQISLADGATGYLSYAAEMRLDEGAERAHIFDHVWRLTATKFYNHDMHHVDWAAYGEAYRRFLPHITNGRDFAELLSEMVGELNASHTGSGYYPARSDADKTASLGLYYDDSWRGAGYKVSAVLANGPVDKANSRIVPGVIITAIDGREIGPDDSIYPLLNRKLDRDTRLSLLDPANGETWEEVVLPISQWDEHNLAYWHWIDQRREMVRELSGGRVGYVHIQAMDETSYRQAYTNIFGRYRDADALVVDIRFNQGGNLTNQLLALLGGKQYLTWVPGDQVSSAIEPYNRWTKPSAVLTNPAAYSDGHILPFSYKALAIGPLVGEPVPGTGTAVWWEDQQDGVLYYGVPQGGFQDASGNWLENHQLEPDVFVPMLPGDQVAGRDPQLEAAVKLLLEELNR